MSFHDWPDAQRRQAWADRLRAGARGVAEVVHRRTSPALRRGALLVGVGLLGVWIGVGLRRADDPFGGALPPGEYVLTEVTPAEKLLRGGRSQWLAADEEAQFAAAESYVKEHHPQLTGNNLIFHTGWVCGRMELLLEPMTVEQAARIADDMYKERFGDDR